MHAGHAMFFDFRIMQFAVFASFWASMKADTALQMPGWLACRS
jgi:hypothetical protein